MEKRTKHLEPDNLEHLELARRALDAAAEIIVRVPWDTYQDRDDLRAAARTFNQAHDRPLEHVVHNAREYRDVTRPDDPFVSVEMVDPFLDFVFAADVNLDVLIAFAETVGPFAWPERPSLHLTPKGAEA